MATITNKEQFKKVIFEELGVEFHNVEITESQWENIYNKALKRLYENDMGATSDRLVALQLVSDWDKANMVFVKKEDFEKLKSDVNSLKDEITSSKTSQSVDHNEIVNLKTQIETLEKSIKSLQDQVANLTPTNK